MTHTAKHTPGPWFVEGSDITNGYPDQGSRILIAEKVAIESDAHLIAAAPAMYEALQEIDDQLDQFTAKAQEELGLREALLKIRAALAQAEGKQ